LDDRLIDKTSELNCKPILPLRPQPATNNAKRLDPLIWLDSLFKDVYDIQNRLHSIRGTEIAASSKLVDHLIDLSSAPLPDIILDEQDKLENKSDKVSNETYNFLQVLMSDWTRWISSPTTIFIQLTCR
jgi:hypothetical protein